MMKVVRIGVTFLKLALMFAGILFIILIVHRSLVASSYQERPDTSQFRMEKIKRGSIENTVSCTGTLSAVGTVEVGTQVSGTINKVLVDYNDRVTKGQILAELDLDTFNAAVDAAAASVIKTSALYKQATADYERNKPLYEQGHLSAEEILVYKTEKETARAEFLSAQAVVKKEKINLRNAQIRSPINGVVLQRDIEEGQTVAASLSTPTLFIIAENLSNMEIEASVDESDIGMVNKGQKVTFTVQSYPDDLFYGTATQIQMNPTEISNVVTYTVIVAAPNMDGKLLPGMTATADFVVEKAENKLLVSNAALNFRRDGRNNNDDLGIYVLDGGTPKRILVTTGITDGTTSVIEGENLTSGISVIVGKNIEKTESSSGFLSKILPKLSGGRPGGGRGPRG
ncbi:efflux RND transporter periplasmic adaptor subunit [Desulfobacter hydrogenophilus]|uniref:Efflux RND transporter periplasmic adaptor subunit n=1 Tax=Desulfobacter hydrogenophilus TaxID=2291 RepID=A0A328FF62_9BACT|nr:efflux RND transporter periplasmic adaptor subunit [Desulfobacter hydrogenophilus]NDY71607.1 efflux RND transporter periplasmic adaptor subunit [Desulfobacter hydrogenophilus]QBH15384.1 efflux RND transporter periplasmic adaptor subunit [Desulfobacter hydrogenophilus]RAM02460.1 efflux RND transporter periplasmic adaptor subunit [Desulfobacter hydrogenophilus]